MSDEDDYNGCVDLDLWDDIKKNGALKKDQVLAHNGTTMSYVNPQVNHLFDLDVDGHTRVKGELIIEADGDEINVGEFMKTISERLCVLQPNFEAIEEYPALKDAYDQYKMLEKLLMENNNEQEKKS